MESISHASTKKYRKLKNPHGDFDYDDPSSSSLSHSDQPEQQSLRIGRLNPEKAAWILVGVAVLFFSKLYDHLLPRQWPQNAFKLALYLAYLSFITFFLLFLYLNYYLKYVRGVLITAKHWKRDAPIAITVATSSGTLGFLFLFIGFFPVYHFWSFLIFPTLFMSVFAFISLF